MSRRSLMLLLSAATILAFTASQAHAQRGVAGHGSIAGRGVFVPAAPFTRGFTNSAGIGLSPSPTIPTLPSIPRTNGFVFRPAPGFIHRPGLNFFHGGLRRPFYPGFGFAFGYPLLAPFYPPLVGYGLPFDYDVSGYGDEMQTAQPSYQTSNMDELLANQAEMADQLKRLNAEINDLKAAQQYNPPSPSSSYVPPSPQTQSEPEQNPPPITLVLHSGQQFQVRNYAVVDHTFWDFTTQPVRKIPLSSIDLAASEKATQANGGEFPPIPSTP